MILSEARPFPKFDWFLPIDGDGGYLGTSRPERLPEFNYLNPDMNNENTNTKLGI